MPTWGWITIAVVVFFVLFVWGWKRWGDHLDEQDRQLHRKHEDSVRVNRFKARLIKHREAK